MELRIATEKDAAVWDDTVRNSPHSTLFHTWNSLKVAEKHTSLSLPLGSGKGKLYPMMGFKGEDSVAVFPLFHYKGLVSCVLSPPSGLWLTHLGPVVKDYAGLKQHKREAILKELIFSVDDFIKKELKSSSVKIKMSPALDDPRAFMWREYDVKPMFDYRLDLSVSEDEMLRLMTKKLRGSIKNGIKSGMEVVEGGKKEMKYILDISTRRLSEQGMEFCAPVDFISDLEFGHQGIRIFCAKIDGKVLSGDIVSCFGDTASIWIGSPKIPDVPTFTNDLLMWEIMKNVKNDGFRYLENQWANDRRLCAYKSKYNMIPSIYFSAEKDKILYRTMKKVKSVYKSS